MFSLESMNSRKTLSEISNRQHNLNQDHSDEISSTKKLISSNIPKGTMASENFIFPVSVNAERSPLIEGHSPAFANVNCLTPNKNKFEAEANFEISPNQAAPTTDFASLKAADFGITPESFTKLSKGESKSLLKKFRRRSTIGVRGSPENDSLIKYIAFLKERRKRDILSQASPSKCRSTLLKNKIAAFQASFESVEETEERINHMPNTDTSEKTGMWPCEQSNLGLVLPLACRRVAAEESQAHNPMKGESSTADTQVVPELQKSIVESVHRPLEATLYATVSNSASEGTTPQLLNATQSKDTLQQSCKKVRFAEKLDLKVFDTTPPITPMQQEGLHSNPLPSVLKNTPRRQLTEGIKDHLEDTRMNEGNKLNLNLKTFGPLQTERSASARDEILVDIPLYSQGAVMFSPSDPKDEASPCMFSVEQPLSQPNFDLDDLPQQSLEGESISGLAISSDMEETQDGSPSLQAISVRITRSSTKRKRVSNGEEKDLNVTVKARTKKVAVVKIPNPKLQKENPAPKSSKNATSTRYKCSGKKRRRKKEKKELNGQRETVSRKPLLSPILETAEELSCVSSCPTTPKSETSISDDCRSNALQMVVVNENENSEKHCLDSHLVLVKEAISSEIPSNLSSGLQEKAMNVMKNKLPWEPPGECTPEKLKSQCPSVNNELQNELKLLKLYKTDKYNESEGNSLLVIESAAEQVTESVITVNFQSFMRRRKRWTCHLPGAENFDPETHRKTWTVSKPDVEDLPPPARTVNESENLSDLERCIEESFRSGGKNNQRRVRRSMRGLKDSKMEGLAWILFSADNGTDSVLRSPCKGQRCASAPIGKELELLHQEEVSSNNTLLPRKEQQLENVHAAVDSVSKRKRNSICGSGPEENKTTLPVQKRRRASFGYKSNRSHLKDSTIKTF